jgi:hypothetical protein
MEDGEGQAGASKGRNGQKPETAPRPRRPETHPDAFLFGCVRKLIY